MPTRNVVIKIILFVVIFGPLPLRAAIPHTYTDQNFWTPVHDRPVSFSQDEAGNFSGTTETGKVFTQINIANTSRIRLQRFSIDDASFYVSDKGIVKATDDITALSIYLALA